MTEAAKVREALERLRTMRDAAFELADMPIPMRRSATRRELLAARVWALQDAIALLEGALGVGPCAEVRP